MISTTTAVNAVSTVRLGCGYPRQCLPRTARSTRRPGRPRPLLQRMHDSAYSIVAQYQTEYQGVVQYYRMAYNLHQLQKLKRVMETSLTRTLAKKFKTSRTQIHRRFRARTTRSTGPTRCWKSAWSGDQRKRHLSRALVGSRCAGIAGRRSTTRQRNRSGVGAVRLWNDCWPTRVSSAERRTRLKSITSVNSRPRPCWTAVHATMGRR